jgi:hypothetical protein
MMAPFINRGDPGNALMAWLRARGVKRKSESRRHRRCRSVRCRSAGRHHQAIFIPSTFMVDGHQRMVIVVDRHRWMILGGYSAVDGPRWMVRVVDRHRSTAFGGSSSAIDAITRRCVLADAVT